MASVDVIVPCYNYGRFLRECVGSALSQEGVDVRVLIIDDCSTDDSAEVGRAIAAADPRVEFRRHEKNRGHISTYNEGIDWLAGDYCLLLSADDMLVPGALARAAAIMDAHPAVTFVYGRASVLDQVRGVSSTSESAGIGRGPICAGRDFIHSICKSSKDPVLTPTVVVRTAAQKAVGGYLPELPHAGDMLMWLLLAAKGDVGYIDEPQACYRVHDRSMHRTPIGAPLADFRERCRVFERFLAVDAQRNILEPMTKVALSQDALSQSYWYFSRGLTELSRSFLSAAISVNRRCRFSPRVLKLRVLHLLGYSTWKTLRRIAGRSPIARLSDSK